MHTPLHTIRREVIRTLALVLLLQSGCTKSNEIVDSLEPDETTSRPLRVVVIETPLLAGSMKDQWRAHEGGDIEIRELTAQEVLDTTRLLADVVIYPSGMIGELIKRGHLNPLSFPDGESGWRDEAVLEHQRVVEVGWEDKLYAVSFGSPQPFLAYRRDIFEQLEIQPPATWSDYHKLVELFDDFRMTSKEQALSQASAEPLAPGDSAIALLARAACYVRHSNQYSGLFDFISMEPLIAGPPFQRALAELVECSTARGPGDTADTSASALRKLLSGQSPMAISWSTRDPGSLPITSENSPLPIAVVELPGSTQAYNVNNQAWEDRQAGDPIHIPLLAVSGRLGSVTELTYDQRRARQFLMFMSSATLSAKVCRPSPLTFPFRTSHVENIGSWLPAEFDNTAAASLGQVVKNAGSRKNYLFCPRIPGRQQYLAALDEAVQSALAGNDPATALLQAAGRWKKISEQLGIEQQKAAYRASLGL